MSNGLSPAGLPPPSEEALQHSERLRALILANIAAAGGAISFAEYMDLVLYAPALGYYSAGAHKFGAAGDFITAPEISPLFARCLANQCAQVLQLLNGGVVMEVGAGSGAMAVDLLAAMAKLKCLPEKYFILERSADLRERQHALLAEKVPEFLDRVEWMDRLPNQPIRGVVLANELLDALPVHLFTMTEEEPLELFVGEKAGVLNWQGLPIRNVRLLTRITAIQQSVNDGGLPHGYTSEINLAADAWIRSLADVLEAGMLLVLDYGFPRSEYYHPQRTAGSLMCHYRHHAHDDPFVWPGLQDVTAHVDFTAMAEAADAASLHVAGYTTQGAFLLACGITEALAEFDGFAQMRMAQGMKKLTLPHEMGELFKVMALTRDIEEPLKGFALHDMRARL